MFARASREIDAKGKFDAGSTRVEEDGAIVGTCAGSNPGDSYDVRVRVLGKDETFAFAAGSAATADDGGSVNPSNPSKPVNPVNPMSPHDARLVDVSCTCPAARAQARGADPAPRFGARSAAPPRAQPPRSCKHSTALLLWRARTLAAVADPDASSERPERQPERQPERRQPERHPERPAPDDAAPRARAPPSRPAAAKRRRLPPSLARSAAAAAEAAAEARAKRAKTPATADPATTAANEEAPSVAVKREPEPPPGAATDLGSSRHDREIVAKVQTVGDAALLDAARRAARGATGARGDDSRAARGGGDEDVAAKKRDENVSFAGGGSDAPPSPLPGELSSGAPSPPQSAPARARSPPRSQRSSAPAMKDMFASFLPAAFKAPTVSAAAAPPAGTGSIPAESRSAGTARPVSSAEPASVPAVSTDAVGEAPAAEDTKGGPKKMSFAELVASGGL